VTATYLDLKRVTGNSSCIKASHESQAVTSESKISKIESITEDLESNHRNLSQVAGDLG
jgi:hypothetical protein